ncbi:hypothetical protein LX77_01084 [Gelidibacter algens]|uniref:Uncharacterized protein n=1 Tax=Gelidibacter algens TaxID=49280 RepID=A0A1A7R797_9FLAO|nr:hypothetical protein [Gelidibacter algens]OBX26617.1 hypothetical protein A9996_03375 [Gelidibacter algens]RAJ25669.1 hypothetical protein LX77_01084 [Gelidibacter algens]
MIRKDIISWLIQILGPLKMQPQPEDSNFGKFQDLLMFVLTQSSLEFRKNALEFPGMQTQMLPEDKSDELDRLAEKIIAEQANRNISDPVYWLRQRDVPIRIGIEESIENFIEPTFSFGPFINEHSSPVWFDFFEFPKQLLLEISQGGIADFLVIALPNGEELPPAGIQETLNFPDCTIWISLKTVVPTSSKKYIGMRAKNCELLPSGRIAIQASGLGSIQADNFQLIFEPFDQSTNNPLNIAQPKALFPNKIALSFSGTKCSVESFDGSSINLNGDTIAFDRNENSTPIFLETDNLIQFSLKVNKDTWNILDTDTLRFQLSEKTAISDAGWYLPIVSTDNNAGNGMLGTSIFTGYLGFRGADGLLLDWPNLANGKLSITSFLLLARPGRMNLKYTFTATVKLNQNFQMWKAISEGESFSSVNIRPLPQGTGICISDNQNMEALIQPVNITAKADRPLNSNQKRFEISDHLGVIEFLKIEDTTSLIIIGNKIKGDGGNLKKRNLLQSLCLHNALLTTGDPKGVFIKGVLSNNETINEGFFSLVFRVYRVINTLPDPYISNQDGIFDDAEVVRFNELWRSGADTLPDQFKFSIASLVKWNDDTQSLHFNTIQSFVNNKISNDELVRILSHTDSPCGPLVDESYNNEEIRQLVNRDAENVLGADGFLKLLPGNRCLVDVSERTNRWGVSFSDFIGANHEDQRRLSESLGYQGEFPFRLKNMDLVSSGRMSRLFTLPHIQWEPVMQIDNPLVHEDTPIPSVINFLDNGAPTRIASAQKNEVALVPRNVYNFIIDGFNNVEKPRGMAAHFSLPFGICAFAYFNPNIFDGLPSAKARANQPDFSTKKTGDLSGAMQLHLEAIPPKGVEVNDKDNHLTYFIGSAIQNPTDTITKINILGKDISGQFNKEFSRGGNEKVPLERIDFSGYGASIFSNWLNESANYGAVSQVRFDVLIGRTAHEVIQIKSMLFPWGAPVVRSVVIQRKNTGIVNRYDSGWVAQGPGEFDYRAHVHPEEANPYNFHPGMVKGIYNVKEIKNIPETMDIIMPGIRFTGVYFNGDIKIQNIIKGALPNVKDNEFSLVHSVGQFGYVMLADPALLNENTTLKNLFPSEQFKKLLNDPKIGGNLGGPINAIIDIGATGQRMQVTRVDVSASNEAPPTFVVAVRGTVEFPKEGSWTVVKCLASKDVIPLNAAEAVPVIRNGLLKIDANNVRKVQYSNSHQCIGDPVEIDKYAGNPPNGSLPSIQYSFLQTTGTQKLLFRRPSFSEINPAKIFHDTPDLADAFRLLKCKTVFPNLLGTLSLPDFVTSLDITDNGSGLKFPQEFFGGEGSLDKFIPPQLTKGLASQEFELLNEAGLQIIISYSANDAAKSPSVFKVDLNSDAVEQALDNERKKYQTINKDVAIKINLGSIKPLLTLRGTFRSEAGKDPVFENPKAELGDELQAVKDILQILALLAGKAQSDNLKVVMGNSPDVYSYKMSIDQNIPVIQFPSVEEITLTTPPPLIIEASLSLGIFFNLSLSPDPKNLIKPGAGAVFGFEGMIQIQLITIGIAAAYGVGITKVKAYVDFADPKPTFEFTFGFGATVVVDLPVVGLVSVTRSFSLAGNIDSGNFRAIAGQMLRGVVSLAGGLLVVAIQIEGSAGVDRKDKVNDDPKTTAIFAMKFSLDVSLAFVISYDFTKTYTEEIALN